MSKKYASTYARLESRKCGLKRHANYIVDGHGIDGEQVNTWRKGVPKNREFGDIWASIEHKWKTTKQKGRSYFLDENEEYTLSCREQKESSIRPSRRYIGKNAKTIAKVGLVTLPNSMSDAEIDYVARKVMALVPVHHPFTMAQHDHNDKGQKNKHLHFITSYRRKGNLENNEDFKFSFIKDLKKTLERAYKDLGYTTKKPNKKKYRVSYKPNYLVRMLQAQHGRDNMKNPHFVKFNVIPELREEALTHEKDSPYYKAAIKSIKYYNKEIKKAFESKQMAEPRIKQKSIEAVTNSYETTNLIMNTKATEVQEIKTLFSILVDESPTDDSGNGNEETKIDKPISLDMVSEALEYVPVLVPTQVNGILNTANDEYNKYLQKEYADSLTEAPIIEEPIRGMRLTTEQISIIQHAPEEAEPTNSIKSVRNLLKNSNSFGTTKSTRRRTK